MACGKAFDLDSPQADHFIILLAMREDDIWDIDNQIHVTCSSFRKDICTNEAQFIKWSSSQSEDI